MNRVMWHLMTRLVGWAAPVSPKESEEEDLLTDWQWMLSNAEEQSQKQSEKHKAEIQAEVVALRKIGNRDVQKKLQLFVTKHYASLPDQQLLMSLTLDASKRDRIMRDTIKQLSEEWLASLNGRFSLPVSFQTQWHIEKYRKNVIGDIMNFAFTASNAGVYTDRTCRDIIWAVYICLSRAIMNTLECMLTLDEQLFILDLALLLLDNLSNLWLQTLKQLGSIAQREGKLPEIWEKEQKLQEARLEQLKLTGQITARFNDGPNDALRQQLISKSTIVASVTSVKDKKSFLEKSLVMRRPK